jgi:hypothetical protein
MIRYDPLVAPDPAQWQVLSEMEQMDAVVAYHRRAGIKLPNALLHATIHSVTPRWDTSRQLTTRRTRRRNMGVYETEGRSPALYVHEGTGLCPRGEFLGTFNPRCCWRVGAGRLGAVR